MNKSFSQLFKATLDCDRDPVLILSSQSLLYANQAAARLWHWPSVKDFIEQEITTLFAKHNEPGAPQTFVEYLQNITMDSPAFLEWPCWDYQGQKFRVGVVLTAVDCWQDKVFRADINLVSGSANNYQHARLLSAYYDTLFESSPDAVVFYDAKGVIVNVNNAFQTQLGYTKNEILGQPANLLIGKEYWRNQHDLLCKQAIHADCEITHNMQFQDKQGYQVSTLTTFVPVNMADHVVGVCAVHRVLEHDFERVEYLKQSQVQLDVVIANAPIILFTLNIYGEFTLTDGRALVSLGVVPGELDGRSIFTVFSHQPKFLANVRKSLNGYRCKSLLIVGEKTFEVRLVPTDKDSEQTSSVIGVAYDITDVHRVQAQLEYLAEHDVLTGLPNRSLFQKNVQQAMTRARQQGQKLAVIFIDLDHFKFVNDSFGHAVGDIFLKKVGQRLLAALRAMDTVARLGGDEFAVLLEGLGSDDDVRLIVDKVLNVLAQPLEHQGAKLDSSASIGVSQFPKDGATVEQLLINADTAMYDAKHQGNTYRLFNAAMRESSRAQWVLTEQLNNGLTNQDFFLVYQPLVDVGSKKIIAFEALLRWQHPEFGRIMPADFIPLAENTGLIVPLGAWVLEQVCKQIAQWRQKGYDFSHVAVNISAQQFRNQYLPQQVQTLLERYQVAGEQLLLEITETTLAPYPAKTKHILEAFSAMGVMTAIDDFGTGYSSLSYLLNYPLDYLKIDKSFVEGTPKTQCACDIIKTIIAMAQSLGLKVIAEGAEKLEQLEFLAQKGCDEVQGFYISKPVDADRAEKMLQYPFCYGV